MMDELTLTELHAGTHISSPQWPEYRRIRRTLKATSGKIWASPEQGQKWPRRDLLAGTAERVGDIESPTDLLNAGIF